MAAKAAKVAKRKTPAQPPQPAKRPKHGKNTQLSSSSSQPSPVTMTADAASDLQARSAHSAGAGRTPLNDLRDEDILSVNQLSTSSDDDDPLSDGSREPTPYEYDEQLIGVSPNPPAPAHANGTAWSTSQPDHYRRRRRSKRVYPEHFQPRRVMLMEVYLTRPTKKTVPTCALSTTGAPCMSPRTIRSVVPKRKLSPASDLGD